MQIKVQFKLQGQYADLARALMAHLRDKENVHMDFNEVCRRQLINWMQANSTVVPEQGDVNVTVASAVEGENFPEGTNEQTPPSLTGDTLHQSEEAGTDTQTGI